METLLPRNAASSPSTGYSHGLLAAVWMITAVATIGVCARMYIRYWRFHRFHWDDFFVIIGWALSIPVAVQTTISEKHKAIFNSDKGNVFLSRPITQLFFYTSLWAVKVSFLIFFRRIGICALENVRKYWFCVCGFTALAYLILWSINPYSCWATKGMTECEKDPRVQRLTPIAFSLATAFDVVTDALIVAIPFALLSNLRLSMRKKVILYSLFSLEIVIIVVAVIRCAIVVSGMTSKKPFDLTILLFLTHLEANTAIIVACAGSLRSLFTQDDQSKSRSVESPWKDPSSRRPIVRKLSADSNISFDSTFDEKKDFEPVVITDSTPTTWFSDNSTTDLRLDAGHHLNGRT